MSGETSARLGLPMLQPGQAQKELTHNEALALLDIAVQPSVAGVRDDPPIAPTPGDCWIVGAAPVADWTGQAGRLAGWTAGGWRFVVPHAGFTAWNEAEHVRMRFGSNGWTRLAALAAVQGPIGVPTGGATVDAEARTAIAALLEALRAHGLVER